MARGGCFKMAERGVTCYLTFLRHSVHSCRVRAFLSNPRICLCTYSTVEAPNFPPHGNPYILARSIPLFGESSHKNEWNWIWSSKRFLKLPIPLPSVGHILMPANLFGKKWGSFHKCNVRGFDGILYLPVAKSQDKPNSHTRISRVWFASSRQIQSVQFPFHRSPFLVDKWSGKSILNSHNKKELGWHNPLHAIFISVLTTAVEISARERGVKRDLKKGWEERPPSGHVYTFREIQPRKLFFDVGGKANLIFLFVLSKDTVSKKNHRVFIFFPESPADPSLSGWYLQKFLVYLKKIPSVWVALRAASNWSPLFPQYPNFVHLKRLKKEKASEGWGFSPFDFFIHSWKVWLIFWKNFRLFDWLFFRSWERGNSSEVLFLALFRVCNNAKAEKRA